MDSLGQESHNFSLPEIFREGVCLYKKAGASSEESWLKEPSIRCPEQVEAGATL